MKIIAIFAGISLPLALLAACTHDFDTFEGVSEAGLVGDGASSKDGASDAAVEACAPAKACTDNARTCAGDCSQNEMRCEGNCFGGNRNNCRAGCKDAGVTCTNGCVTACVTCAGCNANAACQAATN